MSDFLANNGFLTALVSFFVVLVPLILVHELGHFLAGKWAGMTILEFGIGFPPRAMKLFTWRGTLFSLNWLPIGGFVLPYGEDMVGPTSEAEMAKHREAQDFAKQEKYVAVNDVKPLPRIVFMAAGAFANFVLAMLLFTIVGLIGVRQVVGVSLLLSDVSANSLASANGLQSGDLVLRLNDAHFFSGEEFRAALKAADKASLSVLRGTETVNVDLTPEMITALAAEPAENFVQIKDVVVGAPGQVAGIRPGDLVVKFNGEAITNLDDFGAKTRAKRGEEITLTVRRGTEELDISLTPRTNPPAGEGAIGITIMTVGAVPQAGVLYGEWRAQESIQGLSLGESISFGWESITSVIRSTVEMPIMLINGKISPEQARPVSVVGMSQIGAQFIEESITQKTISPILDFIAVISVALGFFNLLPIPALDGGRILFVLVEMVRGKPVSPEREGLVHTVGLIILLSLSVLVILNDVINPIAMNVSK